MEPPPPAGLVARGVAAALDLGVLTAALLAFATFLGRAELTTGEALVFGLASLGYYVAFEAAPGGATPGKRATGIRVADGAGGRAGLKAVLIRTALRPIDSLPWLAPYSFGVLYALATGPERRQRLGDVAADTRVIRVRG